MNNYFTCTKLSPVIQISGLTVSPRGTAAGGCQLSGKENRVHRPAVEGLTTWEAGQNVLYWTPSSFRRQVPNTDTFPDTSDVQTLVLVAVEVGGAETNTRCASPCLQGPSAVQK